uniref:Uncharacterized protein n=1 Tax=Fagus sylvatica TaxID=28930 RepID=A0A2N9IHD1_FAGSY
MRLLTTTTYDGTIGIREHVMRMTNIAMRLRDMKVDIPNSYLVWLILKSLPDQFSVLKTSYNVVKGEWGLDEMTEIVVQQEEMMQKSKTVSAHMVTHNHNECERKFYKGNRNNQNGNKGGKFNNSKPQLKHKNDDMKGKCFWC